MSEILNVHTLIIQIINLAVILYLLRTFLFKPYLSYILEQERKQKEIEQATATILDLRAKAEADIQKLLSNAHAKAAEVRKQAKSVANDQANAIIAEADKHADRIKFQAEDHIDGLRRNLEEKYTESVTRAALAMNKKIFSDTSEANAKFIKTNV